VAESKSAGALRFFLRAFRHRNYRLFFGGQGVSLIGTWMQQIAMSWLVYDLTDSAFMLGVVGFTTQIPTFLFASIAGVYADRWNRHRLIIATQTLAMLQAAILAALTIAGLIQVWHVLILSGFLGIVNAFDIPARQSFVVDLIEDRDDLGNAIALNSFMFNGARLIGPSIGGVLIGVLGEGICFLINAISFLGIITALLAMKIRRPPKREGKFHLGRDLQEGLSYAYRFTPIRIILLQLALISLMGMSYAVLMPVFARDILHGGPYMLGFLMASTGIGALTGAAYLAARKTILGLGRLIAASSGLLGAALIIFAMSRLPWLSLCLLFFVGVGMIIQMAASNTILQSIVEEDKRGRIMSLFAVAGMGMTPFGSLLAGTLASRIGAPDALMISGSACIAGALLFAVNLPRIRQKVRPIYIEKGIISNLPTELQ
jgi:MFS family permease